MLKSYNLSARVNLLSSFLMLIEDIKEQIRYTCIDTETLLKNYTNCERYSQLCFLPELQTLCQKGRWNLKNIKSAVVAAPFARPEDTETFASFFEGLGKSDLQGQLTHCNLYISILNRALENARKESSEKGRLFCLLGLFSGLAVALLLI